MTDSTSMDFEHDLHPTRIPVWWKISYSAFVAVLVPVYLHYYGPTNFLYFCDIALLLTLVGIWREDSLLISMCAVGILAVQTIWIGDFLGHIVGYPTLGVADYMFESHRSPFLRGLSLFHGWLPLFLVFLVWRVGYNPHAFWAWTALSSVVLLICFFYMPAPNPDPGLVPVNINYVWGFSDHVPQTRMPAAIWLLGLIFGLPIFAYAPVHLVMFRFMPRHEERLTAANYFAVS
jgi:hypothetical protein